MRPPTTRQLNQWARAQPDGDYTCAECGRIGPSYWVQPRHPYFADGKVGTALCTDCINESHRLAKIERKKQIDAMPRCEIDGCNRRGTFHVGQVACGRVLLCGAHKKKVQAQSQKRNAMECLLWGASVSRETILKWAVA